MKPSKARRGMTLIELIVSIALIGALISVAMVGYMFTLDYFNQTLKLRNMGLQVEYALENIRVHCISAVSIIDTYTLIPGVTNTRADLKFEGEQDVTNVTYDDKTDNAIYYCYIKNGDLVLDKTVGAVTESEIMVDKQYNPIITFQYTLGTEPNFLTADIATSYDSIYSTVSFSQAAGIRFWFTDAVK